MKLSVVTISFNNESTIEQTIKSVLEQKCKDVEYCIIDGASKDRTLQVVSLYKNKIDQVISEKDDGIYDALNKGVNVARGDVIGFLHADDLFYKEDSLAKLHDFFTITNADVVYCDLVYVYKEDVNKVVRYWKGSPFDVSKLKYGWMPAHPTFYCRRSVFEKHKGFNLKYKIAADYDFMLRVLKDESLKVAYLPETLVKMRVGGASNRSLRNIFQKSAEDYKIMVDNNIGGLFTLFCKNLRKIPQFFSR